VKRWIAIAVLALALMVWWGLAAVVQGNLENDVEFWERQFNEVNAELNASQAKVRIIDIHFEWDEGSQGKIVGEVKNFGSVDAQHVSVRINRYRDGYMTSFGDSAWIDYLRAGENKPFELKVSKPYCDDDNIPQVELSYRTVGEYGREWKTDFMPY